MQEGRKALQRSQATQQLQSEISVLNRYDNMKYNTIVLNIYSVTLPYRFRHPNILQLYGYCLKPLALVFEYMINGSLYDQLHVVEVNQLVLLY